MRVGVTGHRGFLGFHVAGALTDAGHEVCGFDLPDHDIAELPKRAFAGLHAVCHIAAVADVYLAYHNPTLAVHTNVLGTQRVLQQCLTDRVERLVYASSWEVETNLDHPYNITKLSGDLLCQCYRHLYGLATVVLRLGTLYGPRMRETAVIPRFMLQAARGERITIEGTGSQYRQFLHVRDAAAAFVLALTARTNGDPIRVAGAEKVTVRQIAEMTGGQVEYVPARAGDAQAIWIDNGPAKATLGWEPQVPFEAGFSELRAYLLGKDSC